MHALYGGLGSGRLVIAGPPGSGKTGAAVLLILAALRYRDRAPAGDRPKIPVPVLVTAHDWDPRSQPVADWLTRWLRETYPLFTGSAGPAAAEAITDHLLDRVLPAAYAPRPGQPPPLYSLPTATRTLSKIAARMAQDHTRDLRWWHIPDWLPRTPRGWRLAIGFATGLVAGLVFGLVAGLTGGVKAGLGSGIAGGLKAGLLLGSLWGLATAWITVASRQRPKPDVPRRWGRLRPQKDAILIGPVNSLTMGLALWLGGKHELALGFGLSNGLGVALGGMFATEPHSTDSLSPTASWRADRNFGLMFMLMIGLGVGLVEVLPLVGWSWASPVVATAVGAACALTPQGLITKAASASIAAARIAVKWRTPVRLMRFLDDAYDRNVLRTVGPVYQFRHALIQDRLAATTTGTTSAKNTSDPS